MKKWINFLEIATVLLLVLHIAFQLITGLFEGLTTVHWCTILVISINRFSMWFTEWVDDLKNDDFD